MMRQTHNKNIDVDALQHHVHKQPYPKEKATRKVFVLNIVLQKLTCKLMKNDIEFFLLLSPWVNMKFKQSYKRLSRVFFFV